MSKESQTLRDLIASVITGGTLNTTYTTATDYIRAVVDDTGDPALRISLGGSGGGTITFPSDVIITGDLTVSGNTYEQDQYITDELIIGAIGLDGSWRLIQSGNNLLFQNLSGTTWTTRSTITG